MERNEYDSCCILDSQEVFDPCRIPVILKAVSTEGTTILVNSAGDLQSFLQIYAYAPFPRFAKLRHRLKVLLQSE